MKLQDLEIFTIAPPPPGWGGRYWQIVRLTTACGITGLGEVYASALGTQAMRAVIADVFERHMQGESPENIELMARRVWSSGFTQRADPTVFGAFAGLEMACWDILGKARERPVWALLGGKMNDRLRAYTYLYPEDGAAPDEVARFWVDADAQGQAAAARVSEGWTAVKFDPAGPYTIRGGHSPARADISLSAAFCKSIRGAVGDRADLLFGTHGQFTPGHAIRLAKAIEPHDPLWYEEPIPPDDLAGLAEVARKRSELAMEVAALHKVSLAQESRVVLDVGGTEYVTSVATLRSRAGSMLDALLSGRYAVDVCDDGGYRVSLDRDGSCLGTSWRTCGRAWWAWARRRTLACSGG